MRNPILVAAGTSSWSSCSFFGVSGSNSIVTPVMLPPGWSKLSAKWKATGSIASLNTMGIVAVACFAAKAAGRPDAAIALTLSFDEVGGKLRQPAVIAVAPAEHDLDVAALDQTPLAEALADGCDNACLGGFALAAQIADDRHCRLLGERR